jgi:hypothetical protein
MAPPGTRIIAHETTNRRSTWDPHGQYGWYLGPALEHNRCYTVYITKTRGSRIVETVDFFPEKFRLPFPTPQDLATQAATDLTNALLHPQHAGPFCQVGDAHALALKRPAAIFEGATRRKTKITPPPHRKGGQQCTSEGAYPCFTSEGADHNSTAFVSSSQQTTRRHSEFTSPTKNTFNPCSATTDTTCHGATQC